MRGWKAFLVGMAIGYAILEAFAVWYQPVIDQQILDYGAPYNPCDGVLDKLKNTWCPQ